MAERTTPHSFLFLIWNRKKRRRRLVVAGSVREACELLTWKSDDCEIVRLPKGALQTIYLNALPKPGNPQD